MQDTRTMTLAAILLLVACDGYAEIPTEDPGGELDAGTSDPGDGTSDPDDGETPVEEECSVAAGLADCAVVSACASECGTDLVCIEECKSQGCAAAGDAFEVVKSCIIDNCLQECGAGDGDACSTCTESSCGDEVAACEVQECGAGCEEDPTVEDPGEPPPADDASCLAVLSCESSCGLVDFACSQGCAAEVCEAATDAAKAVRTCSLLNCLVDCFDPDAAECAQCVTDSCSEQLTTCSSASCD